MVPQQREEEVLLDLLHQLGIFERDHLSKCTLRVRELTARKHQHKICRAAMQGEGGAPAGTGPRWSGSAGSLLSASARGRLCTYTVHRMSKCSGSIVESGTFLLTLHRRGQLEEHVLLEQRLRQVQVVQQHCHRSYGRQSISAWHSSLVLNGFRRYVHGGLGDGRTDVLEQLRQDLEALRVFHFFTVREDVHKLPQVLGILHA